MKKITQTILAAIAVLLLPATTFAQGLADNASGGGVGVLLTNILNFTNATLIPFIIGIGFLVFVFGMFQYFIAGGANDEKKESGKSLMIYATLGFVFIIIFWGIVNLLAGFTGLDDDFDEGLIPQVTVPGAA
jgi:hypothetical protein